MVNDVVSGVSVIAAIASSLAAVGALWIARSTFERGAELDAFLTLTARYEDIMSALPHRVRLGGEWSQDIDSDFAVRLRYLNLCSEEFYLRERRLLSKQVWGIWDREMRSTLSSEPYREAWSYLRQQFKSYPEFSEFVDQAQLRAAK